MLPDAGRVQGYFDASCQERWFSNFGPCERLFAERCANYLDAHVALVANATIGLVLAMAAVIKTPAVEAKADLVIVPSFTFAATVHAISWCQRQPVFVDVDPDSWHMDPAALEQALSERRGRIAAVIACSSFGAPPPSAIAARWSAACEAAGVPLIVDSAAGFGSELDDGSRLGRQGGVEVFSFHATKPFAIGEGGAVASRDEGLIRTVHSLSNFGMNADREIVHRWGLNGKMSEQQAATGLAVFDQLDEILAARRSLASVVVTAAKAAGYKAQTASERGTWQFIPLRVPEDRDRNELIIAAGLDGIECRAYYRPLHWSPVFASAEKDDLTHTDALGLGLISLPMANDLSDREVERLCSFLARHGG